MTSENLDRSERAELESLRLERLRAQLREELRGDIDDRVERRVKAELAGVEAKLDELLARGGEEEEEEEDQPPKGREEEEEQEEEQEEEAEPERDAPPARVHFLHKKVGR